MAQYTFSIALDDAMSGKLARIGQLGETSFNQLSAKYKSFKSLAGQVPQGLIDTSSNVQRLALKMTDLERRQKKAFTPGAARTYGNAIKQTQQEILRYKGSINGLTVKLNQLKAKHADAYDPAVIRKFKTQINQTERSLDKLKNLPPASFKDRLKGIGSQFGGLVGVAGGFGLALGAFRGVGSILKLGADMEQTRISFQTMLGSVEKGNDVIKQLNDLSNSTPFQNEQIIAGGRSLLAAGVGAKDLNAELSKIGDVSAGSKKDFNELAGIYAKVRNSGKMQAEELNQLNDAGIPIMEVLKEKYNATGAEIYEMGSKGKLSFNDLSQSFDALTNKGGVFENLMAKLAESGGGKWSTLTGKISLLAAKIGEKLMPVASSLMDVGIGLIDVLASIPFGSIASSVSTLAPLIGAVALSMLAYNIQNKVSKLSFFSLKKGLVSAKLGFKGLNTTMRNNPIGMIITGVGLLWTGFTALGGSVEMIKGSFMAAWSVVKDFGKLLMDNIVGSIKNIIGGLGTLGSAIKALFNRDFSGAAKLAKDGFVQLGKGMAVANPVGLMIKTGMDAKKDWQKIGGNAGKAYQNAFVKEQETVLDENGNEVLLDENGNPVVEQNNLVEETKSTNTAIVTGGKKSVITTINIGNIIETVNQKINDTAQSADEVVDMVIDGIVSRVHGAVRISS